jgi:hypothetical protein
MSKIAAKRLVERLDERSHEESHQGLAAPDSGVYSEADE